MPFLSIGGKYDFSMPEILKHTASSDFPDVEFCNYIEATREDGITREVTFTTRRYDSKHCETHVLPRWKQIWTERGIELDCKDKTFTIRRVEVI